MSLVGIPSVIQTITAIPASAASKIASAAKAGGTKIIETLASCRFNSFLNGIKNWFI
jgi:hypothetical protein